MVEEIDINSNEVLGKFIILINHQFSKVRKYKKPTQFGEGTWIFEIGQADNKFDPSSDLLAPSSKNPVFLRKDTDSRFEWRIRNLPYPKETYTIELDHNK